MSRMDAISGGAGLNSESRANHAAGGRWSPLRPTAGERGSIPGSRTGSGTDPPGFRGETLEKTVNCIDYRPPSRRRGTDFASTWSTPRPIACSSLADGPPVCPNPCPSASDPAPGQSPNSITAPGERTTRPAQDEPTVQRLPGVVQCLPTPASVVPGVTIQ